MQLISLFSGIGGFEIASEWMGWKNIFSCEINPFGQKVLKYYWPDAIHHDDVKTIDYSIIKNKLNLNEPTILVAGFPCQPFSTAGKRKGTEDERYGWPDCVRAVHEIQPNFCVFENVSGLISWNGGMVFDEVQADLEVAGYSVIPFILPACGVNAPHRRDRVWFVAHKNPNSNGRGSNVREEESGIRGFRDAGTGNHEWIQTDNGETGDARHAKLTGLEGGVGSSGAEGFKQGCEENDATNPNGGGCDKNKLNTRDREFNNTWGNTEDDATNTYGIGSQGGMYSDGTGEAERYFGSCNPRINGGATWDNFPTQPPVRGIHDGISELLVRNIKPEIYATISERYTDKDLQEVWKSFQSPEIRGQIGRLYKIRQPDLLLEVLQLCSPANNIEKGLSVWSEKTSEGILRKLQEYGTLNNTPHGRELGKQFTREFADTLHILSHEIALVTMEAERAAQKFASWHRQESIKGYGNAVVPQVVLQIFKAIEQYELLNTQ